jgi:outer membrane protein
MQRYILSGIFLVLAACGLHAQSRIAYLDAAAILKRMPEAQDAQAQVDRLTDDWKREALTMEQELTRKRTEYERKKLIMTDAERNAIELDISELKKRLDKYRQDKFGANGELFSQQQNLMKPVYGRLLKAIDEVAAEGKYDYVFDRSSKDHLMLYSNAKFDLTLAVVKKLGIETNDVFSVPLLNKDVKSPFETPTGTTTKQGQQPPPVPEQPIDKR